jgi:hypothetical protein
MAIKPMTPDEWNQCLHSNINRVLGTIIALECLHSVEHRVASYDPIPNAETSVIETLEMEASNLGVPDDWRGILVSFSDAFKDHTGRRPHQYDDPQSYADKLEWWNAVFPDSDDGEDERLERESDSGIVDHILEGEASIG